MNKITTDDLRRMKDAEGLILQGCGGDLKEWVDGINELLEKDEVLQQGTKFSFDNCCFFENNNVTNILFPFTNDVKLSMGRISIWRVKTHDTFCGAWLSDYIENQLGGFISDSENTNVKLFGGKIMNRLEFEERTEKLYTSDTYVSPDFQSDQTGGFPASLCVNWDTEQAWLALNYSLVKSGQDVSEYEQMCADYGIRNCHNAEQFNDILRELGEDAIQSGEIIDDKYIEMGGM